MVTRMTPEERVASSLRFLRAMRFMIALIIGWNAWRLYDSGPQPMLVWAQAVAILCLYANYKTQRTYVERNDLMMATRTTEEMYAITRVPYLAHLGFNLALLDPYQLYRASLRRWGHTVKPFPERRHKRPPPPDSGD